MIPKSDESIYRVVSEGDSGIAYLPESAKDQAGEKTTTKLSCVSCSYIDKRPCQQLVRRQSLGNAVYCGISDLPAEESKQEEVPPGHLYQDLSQMKRLSRDSTTI